jgi:hypothetical protein
MMSRDERPSGIATRTEINSYRLILYVVECPQISPLVLTIRTPPIREVPLRKTACNGWFLLNNEELEQDDMN